MSATKHLLWAVLLFSTAAHGLECRQAHYAIERVLCSDASLRASDQTLRTIYQQDLSRLSSNSVGLLRVDQVQWLSFVQLVCDVNDPHKLHVSTASCLKPLYSDRIKQLRGSVSTQVGLSFLTRTQYLAEPENIPKDQPAGNHPGYGTMQASWPAADTDAEEWIAWSAAVEAHMLRTAGAGQTQELRDGSKRTLPATWDDSMATGADTQISARIKSVEHDRVTTVITTFGMGHGAAHPINSLQTLTWLLKQKRKLRATDIFSVPDWQQKLAGYAWADLSARNKKEKFLFDEINGPDAKGILSVVSDLSNWTLEEDGLHISYPDYAVAPRFATPEDTVIQWSRLKPLLTPDFPTP